MSEETVKVTQHWCLTEDRTRVVPETDVEACTLLWPTGTVVSMEDAIKYGMMKRRFTPANKSRKPGGDK